MQHMYWFITISRKADAEEIIELYKRFEVPRLYCTLAHGTAKSQTLDLFGIEQSEKVVHQAVITHNKLRELKKTLEMDFQIDLPTAGSHSPSRSPAYRQKIRSNSFRAVTRRMK